MEDNDRQTTAGQPPEMTTGTACITGPALRPDPLRFILIDEVPHLIRLDRMEAGEPDSGKTSTMARINAEAAARKTAEVPRD